MNGRLRRLLSELRRSERGVALPMVLIVTVVAMGFAAVPVVASMNAQNGDSHNQGTNEALAAAEAGAEVALLAQSKMLGEASEAPYQGCVAPTQLIESGGSENGWCSKFPAVGEARPKVGEAEYSYQVRPCYTAAANGCVNLVADTENCSEAAGNLLVEIVATGYATVGGVPVEKRIAVTGCAATKISQKTEGEITVKKQEIVETKEKVTKKTTEIKEVETHIENLETVEKTEIKSVEETRTSQIEVLEKKEAKEEGELTVLERELVELEKSVERVEKEPAGVEYTETPGEKYTETTKTPPPNVWGGGQIVGIEGLTMGNNAQIYNGGAASNKEVNMVGSANVCGTVHYGTVFHTDNSSSEKAPSSCAAGRTVSKATGTYPAVTLPSNIATENSDSRLCTETACHKGEDPVPSSVWERGNMSYNASNKQLTVSYSSLTLEGTKPYYLCQLILAGGSSLYAGTGKAITIYFAPPSSCPGLNGAAQLQVANGTYVYADASNGPKFLFVGSSTSPSTSKIEFAGGAKSEQFVVYAPYSKIIANNGIEMTGAIIGNTLELQGGASINKYGTFTAPPAESFLPSTETVVEKQKEGTKTAHPSKYLEQLREEVTIWKGKIETKTREIEAVEKQIRELVTIEEKEIGSIVEVRETEIKNLEVQRVRLETERNNYKVTITRIRGEVKYLEGTHGGTVEAMEKKSFQECSAEPATLGLAPDAGC